jgi:hypothetical protein
MSAALLQISHRPQSHPGTAGQLGLSQSRSQAAGTQQRLKTPAQTCRQVIIWHPRPAVAVLLRHWILPGNHQTGRRMRLTGTHRVAR